jgi:hypothetical protein
MGVGSIEYLECNIAVNNQSIKLDGQNYVNIWEQRNEMQVLGPASRQFPRLTLNMIKELDFSTLLNAGKRP